MLKTAKNVAMKNICLVACTSRKALYPTTAENLYRSPLFDSARWFAENRCDSWYILSAKYGLLLPGENVVPYDESLHQMGETQRRSWAEKVYRRLSGLVDASSRIVFLAGDKYRKHLQKFFEDDGRMTSAPLSELGIGRQVAWLQKLVSEQDRLKDVDRFYRLLVRIANIQNEQKGKLSERNGRTVAKQGIYFFWQADESRMSRPFEDRVVRIGTHAVSTGSKATLWNRLRTHRGGENGSGNHRGSIFRLHVGQALIRKAGLEAKFPTWGVGQSASEAVRAKETELELEVSRIIAAMPMLCLSVLDEASPDSDRSYLERNLIALLCGPTGPIDLPSGEWLGKWSSRTSVSSSGLWNVNHVYEEYDPHALDVLERYVEIAEGVAEPVRARLAPAGWRTRRSEARVIKKQLMLV